MITKEVMQRIPVRMVRAALRNTILDLSRRRPWEPRLMHAAISGGTGFIWWKQ